MQLLEYLKLKLKKKFSKYFEEYYTRARLSSFPFICGIPFLAISDCAILRDYQNPFI